MEVDPDTMKITESGYRFFRNNNRFEKMDGMYDIKNFFLTTRELRQIRIHQFNQQAFNLPLPENPEKIKLKTGEQFKFKLEAFKNTYK